MITYLRYDGSFDGFLTATFERYERKLNDFAIVKASQYQPELNSACLEIQTDQVKSKRVWTGLKNNLSTTKRNEFYKTFLSELPEMERLLSNFITYAFSSKHNIEGDLGHPSVIGVTKIAHQVHREKHRMEAFIRFQRTKDDLYFATISPDFNVLPLIIRHFKDRYADQHWLIHDQKRKYGVHYDCSTATITEVQVQLGREVSNEFLPENLYHEDEVAYQKLWKNYFYSVNIGALVHAKMRNFMCVMYPRGIGNI
jgi:probable DNA metabolism protein